MISLNHTFNDLLYFLLHWKQHVLFHLHYYLILTLLSAHECPESQNNWVDQVTTILHMLPSLLAHTQHSLDNILHPLRNMLFWIPLRLARPFRFILCSTRPERLLCILLHIITSVLLKEYRRHSDFLPLDIANTLSELLQDTESPLLLYNTNILITHFTHRSIEGLITITLGTLNKLYAHLTLSIERFRTLFPKGFPTPLTPSQGPLENCSAASVPAIGPMQAPILLPHTTPSTPHTELKHAPLRN
jgi:hypothetical protein